MSKPHTKSRRPMYQHSGLHPSLRSFPSPHAISGAELNGNVIPHCGVSAAMLPLAGLALTRRQRPQRRPLFTGFTISPSPRQTTKIKLPKGARVSAPVWAPDANVSRSRCIGRSGLRLGDGSAAAALRSPGSGAQRYHGRAHPVDAGQQNVVVPTVPERGARGCAHGTRRPTHPGSYGKLPPREPIRTCYEALMMTRYSSITDLAAHAGGTWFQASAPGSPARPLQLRGPAPSGRFFLVAQLKKPFSRLLTVSGFAREVLVWDIKGAVGLNWRDLPSQEGVPIEGVPLAREAGWRQRRIQP